MRDRPSTSDLFAWTLVGFGIGLAAGLTLGGWLGPPHRRSTDAGGAQDRPSGVLRPVEAARAVRRTLEQDEELRALGLQVLAVGPGVVELHGWVTSRSQRARAARIAARTEGIESLVNCLLVHGEDDPPGAVLDATDQPA
jgi:hypothetical protein